MNQDNIKNLVREKMLQHLYMCMGVALYLGEFDVFNKFERLCDQMKERFREEDLSEEE